MISVVIATFNRQNQLDACLRGFAQQSLPREEYEVIVVDDGSDDKTASVLSKWVCEHPSVRFRVQKNAGPAGARNTGILSARGDVIAFTDDDCIPASDWLERIAARYSSGFKGCIHGAVHTSVPEGTFIHSVTAAEPEVATCNLAVDREALLAAGLFDTRFRVCEDADLYYRLRKQSTPVEYDPAVIIEHPPRYQDFFTSLKRRTLFLYFYGLIARKHPSLEPFRRHLSHLLQALKKIAMLALFTIIFKQLAGLPWLVAILAAPFPFCIVDAYRLSKLKKGLASHGVKVTLEDQLLYILLNWSSNLVEAYFLIKGYFHALRA